MQTDSFNLLLQSANNLTEIVTLLYKMRKKTLSDFVIYYLMIFVLAFLLHILELCRV